MDITLFIYRYSLLEWIKCSQGFESASFPTYKGKFFPVKISIIVSFCSV